MLQKCDTWKLLELFFKRPLYSFHLREICRLMSWSPTKVRSNLNLLKRLGLVIEFTEKNLLLFKSNRESEEFKIYKTIYNLLYAFKISRVIESELEDFDAIILFGSASKGEDIEESDFDLCIIGAREVKVDLKRIEKEIERRIALLFIENLEKIKKENPELLNNLINGFVIKGYLKVI